MSAASYSVSILRFVFSKQSARGFVTILKDFHAGIKGFGIWSEFAWEDIQSRYRRSMMGLAWIMLSYVIFVFGIALFFGGLSSMAGRDFTIYVAVSILAYQFLISAFQNSPTVFVNSANWIKSINLPYSMYIFGNITKDLFPFILQLIAAFGIILLLGWRPTLTALYAIPALGVMILNAAWMFLLLGTVGARMRDLQHLTSSLARILFFATPIMWTMGDQSAFVQSIAMYNPLTHLIAIFRDPLLGGVPTVESIEFVAVFTIFGWVSAFVIAAIFQRRIAFWIG